jgi:hypothetical protein
VFIESDVFDMVVKKGFYGGAEYTHNLGDYCSKKKLGPSLPRKEEVFPNNSQPSLAYTVASRRRLTHEQDS